MMSNPRLKFTFERWATTLEHVYPVNDAFGCRFVRHIESVNCWCVPERELVDGKNGVKDMLIVTHHALDERELDEGSRIRPRH